MPTGKSPSALAAAAGSVTILCLPFFSSLVSFHHLAVYHQKGPASQLFLPILIDSLLLWLLFAAILHLIRRRRMLRVVFWAAMVCLLPLMAIKAVVLEAMTSLSHTFMASLMALSFVVFLILLFLAKRSSSPQIERFLHIAEVGAALVAWSGVLLLAQTLWFMGAARAMPEPPLLQRAPTAAPRPTVIWILFDELSQDQLFDHRFPGLALPAFDRFAAQATTFSQTVPTNLYTEVAVPALMTGLPVKHIESSANGRTLTLILPSGRRQPFDPQQTIFGDAQRLGFPTSIDGWYNPYCRILSSVLNRCTWVPGRNVLPGGFRTETPVAENLGAPLTGALPTLMRIFAAQHALKSDRMNRRNHVEEYRQVESAAMTLLAEPQLGFVMLHIPAPHPEGIYNRHTGRLSGDVPSSYVGNLALADRFLAEVEAELSSKQEWDDATVVIMGDHSWRTRQVWRNLSSWTPEDEIASRQGVFDPRPAYLVKLPHQHTPAHFDQTFDALRNRALIDQLLGGQIQTPQQLQVWAAHP